MSSKAGCYVIRTRKPHALIGLPFIGRHFGYIGQTTRSFRVRIEEHLSGGGRYAAVPKPWADLEPKVYFIPMPRWEWLQRWMEQLLIWVLCPVYNVKGQGPWNLRKVSLWTARVQRQRRDLHGSAYRIFGTLLRWVLYISVLVIATYVWSVNR